MNEKLIALALIRASITGDVDSLTILMNEHRPTPTLVGELVSLSAGILEHGCGHAKTSCRGHDLTDQESVIVHRDGHRQCRMSHALANAEAYRRRKANAPPTHPNLPSGQTECVVDGSTLPRRRAGAEGLSRFCSTHLQCHLAYGETFPDVPPGYKRGQSLYDSRAELAASQF